MGGVTEEGPAKETESPIDEMLSSIPPGNLRLEMMRNRKSYFL